MITVKFVELLDAFDFANYAGPIESMAYINLDTGILYCAADGFDCDDVPDDLETSDRYLALPHKNDLDLGRALALSFAQAHLLDDYDTVLGYFSKRGAYAKFKDLLGHRGVLDTWHSYEKLATERALRDWCEEHDIQLDSADSTT